MRNKSLHFEWIVNGDTGSQISVQKALKGQPPLRGKQSCSFCNYLPRSFIELMRIYFIPCQNSLSLFYGEQEGLEPGAFFEDRLLLQRQCLPLIGYEQMTSIESPLFLRLKFFSGGLNHQR